MFPSPINASSWSLLHKASKIIFNHVKKQETRTLISWWTLYLGKKEISSRKDGTWRFFPALLFCVCERVLKGGSRKCKDWWTLDLPSPLFMQPRTESTFWAVNAHSWLMSCFLPIFPKSEGKAGHPLHAYLEVTGVRTLIPHLCHPALFHTPWRGLSSHTMLV